MIKLFIKIYLFILKVERKTIPTVIVTSAGVGKVNPRVKRLDMMIKKYEQRLKYIDKEE